ncbi:MAG: hypothetical protein E7173_01325 [Firmicutes bacterium]|nr:hypothetical protein [Bacillota bacterium]
MDICTNPNALKLLDVVLKAVDILKIAIMVVLIIIAMIDFGKSIFSSDQNVTKTTMTLFAKRLIAAMLIFLIPVVIETGIVLVGDMASSQNFTDCIENTNNIPYYEALQIYREREEAERDRLQSQTNGALSGGVQPGGTDGIYLGQKYNLTDSQLTQLAALCEMENSGAVAAEASLMANLFEFQGSSYGTGAEGLYNYIKNGGWFSSGAQLGTLQLNSQDSKTIVYEVLVQGKRTLPLYINEHDCIDCGPYGFDVVKISIDGTVITDEQGLLNKNNYIKDKTIIYNRYGAVYAFYTFPCSDCDPFGYTAASKQKYDNMNNN